MIQSPGVCYQPIFIQIAFAYPQPFSELSKSAAQLGSGCTVERCLLQITDLHLFLVGHPEWFKPPEGALISIDKAILHTSNRPAGTLSGHSHIDCVDRLRGHLMQF